MLFLILFLLFSSKQLFAQPYIDLFSTQYLNSPTTGINSSDKNPTTITYYNIGLNLPFELNNSKKTYLLFNPYFEHWKTSGSFLYSQGTQTYTVNSNLLFQGIAFPIGVMFPITNRWKLLATFIYKHCTGTDGYYPGDQIGGYLLNTIEKNERLNLRFGLYYNREFFGNFFMPLAGLDWKISNTDKLFGVLPAKLTYEHKLQEKFYVGGLFETITTSYPGGPTIYSNQGYINNWYRIDDNRLSVYADYYPAKKIALRFEVGHSILRKIRSANIDYNVTDNLYFRMQANYRLRF